MVRCCTAITGPISRYLGSENPGFQRVDPVPAATGAPSTRSDIASLKEKVLAGPSVSQLVKTAWASAASFRGTDKRGGQRCPHLPCPQKDWDVNEPPSWPHRWARALEDPAGLNGAGGAGFAG